jgi:hypothetical protein
MLDLVLKRQHDSGISDLKLMKGSDAIPPRPHTLMPDLYLAGVLR